MEMGQGRCACGSVELTITADPIIVHGCHCRYCQRMTGSAFAINIMIELSAMDVSGEVEIVPTPSTLPQGQLLARCAQCHVALWSHHPGLGERIAFVSAGVLDVAERYVPDVHCHTASRHPWVRLPDDRPEYEGDYDADVVWSPEMHRRISACLE